MVGPSAVIQSMQFLSESARQCRWDTYVCWTAVEKIELQKLFNKQRNGEFQKISEIKDTHFMGGKLLPVAARGYQWLSHADSQTNIRINVH